MTRAPELSVVIPTHNRRASLLRLLGALRNGTLSPDRFEVIVSADGCSDDTVDVLSRTAFPWPLRVVEQTPAGGAARARNLGAQVARGETIVFVDDDIEPFASMLEVHATAHADARAGGSEPLVLIGAPVPVRAPDSGFHHIAVWGWWEQQLERMAEPGHRFAYHDVFTGILSMPASVFADVGGFEPSLPFSCRDDSELGLRLIKRGVRIAFSREGGGRHHEMRPRESLLRRKLAEGSADALLARLHPELWRALPLSLDQGTIALRTLRGLAFGAPAVGGLIARAASLLLDGLEWLRMRGSWRRVNAALMYYEYWRGVASFLGGKSALVSIAEAARIVEGNRRGGELSIDLADGVVAAAAAVDAARPDALRVLFAGREIGRVEPRAGAEPLRGRHIGSELVRHLAGPLAAALALEEVAGRRAPWPLRARAPAAGTAS
ncbi:MAG: glycosyltransferase family 2 protein [Gemmatimonadaceae bacterium]